MPTEASPSLAGWAFPSRESRKCHWFDDGDNEALCGRWLLLRRDPAQMMPDTGKSKDDCAACRRKLDARKAKADPAVP